MKTKISLKTRTTRLLTSALSVLLLAPAPFAETVATESMVRSSQPDSGAANQITTVYLVRHAEKHLDQGKDPDLTEQGVSRSRRWADVFSNQSLDEIYSTDTTRTLNTAQPIAESQGKPVALMDPIPENLNELIGKHLGKSILMVGHSNTLPDLVNAMIGEKHYADLDESNYNTLFIVTLNGNTAIAQQLKISL